MNYKTTIFRICPFLFVFYLSFFTDLQGQVTTRFIKGIEASKIGIHPPRKISIAHKVMSPINLKIIQKEDSLEMIKGLPFRFGKDIAIDIDLIKEGTHVTNKDTTLIYYQISTKGAYSINLIFDKFHLMDNTTVRIYNSEQSVLYGPITSKENTKNGIFWTDLIKGESIIIEVSIIGGSTEGNLLHISKVIHGYVNVFAGYGQSASCNRDVMCSEGNGWGNEAGSVVMLLFADGTRFGSGSLVNNTSQDFRPYILTAFHCVDTEYDGELTWAEKSAVNNWVFRFKYYNYSCGGSECQSYVSYNGATFRAGYQPSDFSLLELNVYPTNSSGIYYSGWNRNTSAATFAVGIHHPAGDVKKISVDQNGLSNVSVTTPWTAQGVTLYCPPDTHWEAVFNTGTVQYGSSGSPIFDQNHRIVGQLHGDYLTDGQFCVNKRGHYGKFNVSWGGGSNDSTRLSNWLDPESTGAYTTNTSSISFSGPDFVCSSGTYFTVNNLPSGATITWSCSENITRASAQGSNPCTFQPNTDGYWGTINATINCNNVSYELEQKDVWVGLYNPPTGIITYESSLCKYTDLQFYIDLSSNPNPFTATYNWRIENYLNADITVGQGTLSIYVYPYESGSLYFSVVAENECGLSSRYFSDEFIIDDCYLKMVLSPNPASDRLKIKLQDNSTGIATLEIINSQGVKVISTSITGNEETIDISRLPKGLYYISVFSNSKGKSKINTERFIKE